MVGDSAVGKSSLLNRFTSGNFNDEQASTIGVDFKVKILELEDGKYKYPSESVFIRKNEVGNYAT